MTGLRVLGTGCRDSDFVQGLWGHGERLKLGNDPIRFAVFENSSWLLYGEGSGEREASA